MGACGTAARRAGDRRHRAPLPLVVAHNDAGSFAASDMTALVEWAEHVQVLEDGDLAELHADGIWWQRSDGSSTARTVLPTKVSSTDVSLGDAPDHGQGRSPSNNRQRPESSRGSPTASRTAAYGVS
jgi:hypothetical protein